MRKLLFIKSLWSPFKPFGLKWYCGKTAIGTPYFLPRKWVKATSELAHKAALEHIAREEGYNNMNPTTARPIKSYDEIYQEKLRYEHAIPRKIGFDFVGLGYKTKWSDTDYRFEWSPLLSFVFFGYQIAVWPQVPESDKYWEAWLFYEQCTDRSKPKAERIQVCMNEFPLIYKVWHNDKTTPETKSQERVNYYERILRSGYLKYIQKENKEQ
jgi:hypothetical protein